jgi:hypothetical protein
MNNHTDAAGLVQQGTAAFKAGDTQAAAKLLYQATKADPQNQSAWLWLSGCVTNEHDRRMCLERVMAIDPNSAVARQAAAQLQGAPAAETAAPPREAHQTPPVTQSAASSAPVVGDTLDRQLMEWSIDHWTAGGWVVVSQTETAVQLKMPHRLGCAGMFLVGMGPALAAWFVFFLVGSSVFLFLGLILMGVIGMLASIGEYLAKRDELVYLMTGRLRKAYDANGAVRVQSSKRPRCSFCRSPIRNNKATDCPHCKRHLVE